MKSIEQFQNFYETDLRPSLEELENKRKRIRNTLLIVGGIVLSVIAGLIVLTSAQNGNVVFYTIFGGIIVMGTTWHLTARGFCSEFKKEIIAPIVKFCDENLTYYPDSGISSSEFRNTGIFKQSIDRYKCEDLVKGQLGATQLKFSEVHAEYKTETRDSKGRRQTHWHTIFKGLFFAADFNKHFKGRTIVLPDTAQKIFGLLGQSLQSIFKHSGELVKLEDIEFEKLFVVYSDDQVEARYILSTSLMQRITEFRKKTKNSVYLSFTGSNVNVAITMNRDLFEPRIFSTLLNFNVARQYLEDLQFAVGIVDELNLNNRIWTKE